MARHLNKIAGKVKGLKFKYLDIIDK